MALARSGDTGAFEELVRRRQGFVRGLMRQLCGDPALADDLAQEVFLLAWRKLKGLKRPEAFGGWLRRIAVNLFLQQTRRKDLVDPDSENLEKRKGAGDGDRTARMDLERALDLIRPGERLCVVLSYSQGLSHSEIGSVTGLPLGTVKSHIARGTARLRRYLAEYEEGVR